jgi:hypothetical protein
MQKTSVFYRPFLPKLGRRKFQRNGTECYGDSWSVEWAEWEESHPDYVQQFCQNLVVVGHGLLGHRS